MAVIAGLVPLILIIALSAIGIKFAVATERSKLLWAILAWFPVWWIVMFFLWRDNREL